MGHMFPCMFHFKGGKGILSGGTIAIKLEFPTGEKYVLVIRENGVDLNLAAPAVE